MVDGQARCVKRTTGVWPASRTQQSQAMSPLMNCCARSTTAARRSSTKTRPAFQDRFAGDVSINVCHARERDPRHDFVVVVRDVAPRLIRTVDRAAFRLVPHDGAHIGQRLSRVNLGDHGLTENGVLAGPRIAWSRWQGGSFPLRSFCRVGGPCSLRTCSRRGPV